VDDDGLVNFEMAAESESGPTAKPASTYIAKNSYQRHMEMIQQQQQQQQ
jgi:hypothetical protein